MSEILGDKGFDNKPSIEAKALRINLNKYIYGTFAEIGAGQEVARHFFRVGGASWLRLKRPLSWSATGY
jgi:hypothetical protein